MKNIVLIGMPACGKSTIGYWLSKKIDYPLLDVDRYLEEKENRIISDIFSNEGEEYFRELETKYLKELSEKEGIIISTGGGAVKKKENIDILKENGIVVFLNRTIDDISRENHRNRPLLQNTDNIQKLYDERIKLYRRYADIIIKNDDNIDVIVDRIITVLKGKIL
ncbi:shikimate kinase [Leptotrichia sp. oral taxon 879]|uniref:shikimate kinase n=1 Tax=Leptotrichia sp. oral taxon 879 TaxID=1227267 RepID=UPI0003AD804F|nr:shikimate kinase [Leptotrichia sp. oral taxon 879]ERK55250.1 shikimate kinase [Leptotrichia sp. oral taxon 879 str. F0557]